MTNKEKIKILVGIGTVILLIGIMTQIVYAAGVSTPYWDNGAEPNPLSIYPGETKDFQFLLSNSLGDGDLIFTPKIIEGSEVLSFTDSDLTYLVKARTGGVAVNVRVSVPANTSIGTTYKVKVGFLTSSENTGQIQVGSGFTETFNVVVIEKAAVTPPAPAPAPTPAPEKNAPVNIALYLLIILIVIVIVIIIIKSRKKKRKR